MSTLTFQCDSLRSWADQFDERADFDALAPLLARDLREAADTIERLRDRLQDVKPMLVWDYKGNLLITLGGLKTWDVTNEAKAWFKKYSDAATIQRGECEITVLDTGNEAAYEHYEYIMHCENCHHEYGYVQYDEDGGTWMDDLPNHCPNCGKKVKR